MKDIHVRLARLDDRPDLNDVQRRASFAGYPRDVVAALEARPELFDLNPEWIAGNQVFVAESGGAIVGFAVIVPHEENDAELEGLFVEPAHWRHGIGTLLLRQVEREAHAWGATRLHVVVNPFAEAFYEASGFTAHGERRMDIGPPAKLMVKPVRQAG